MPRERDVQPKSGLPPLPYQPPPAEEEEVEDVELPPQPEEESSPSAGTSGTSGNGNGNGNSTASSTVAEWPPSNLYRCPLHWGLYVVCPYHGTPYDLYEHFNGEYIDHAGYEIERITMTAEPIPRVWPRYAHTCDDGTNLNEEAIYRLLIRYEEYPHLLFLLTAKSTQRMTRMHLVFIGPKQRAKRYHCAVRIESKADPEANPINMDLTAVGTDGWNKNILVLDEDDGDCAPNETLKEYCEPSTGDLHFWIAMFVPPEHG